LNFAASLAQSAIACARPIDAVLDAFRSGEGLTFDGYGPDAQQSQEASHRAMTRNGRADDAPQVSAQLSRSRPRKGAPSCVM
jgi:hypothetical protein